MLNVVQEAELVWMFGRKDPLDLGAQHVEVLEGTRLP
jgi:hypothetical protein